MHCLFINFGGCKFSWFFWCDQGIKFNTQFNKSKCRRDIVSKLHSYIYTNEHVIFLQSMKTDFNKMNHIKASNILNTVYMSIFYYWISGPSWPWSHDSWIYNYLCNQCLSPLTRVQILLMAFSEYFGFLHQ